MDSYRYDAFISYRHVEPDRRWAKWLHRALETYRVPRRLVRDRGIAPRLTRVFRDEEEVPASSDLGAEIEQALLESRFLIVVCSPRTPGSEWVNREIERFREMGQDDRILALLIEGEPSDAFPRALREIRRKITSPDGLESERIDEIEPLAADVRASRTEGMRWLRRMAKLRLLACVLGCRFDDLRQREQERRTRVRTVAAAALAVVAAGFAVVAVAAVRAEGRATASRARALEDAKRLAELGDVREVLLSVNTLFPTDRASAARWTRLADAAKTVLGGLDGRRAELERLRSAAAFHIGEEYRFADPTDEATHRVLADLVHDGDAIRDAKQGALGVLKRRFERPPGASEDTTATLWKGAIAEIANEKENPDYHGLAIEPAWSLHPLGKDPDSHRFEFAHLYSGSLPVRRDGHLIQAPDAAIVLVLIPGGTFAMGTAGETDQEGPAHEVTLSPYFVAKYEMTRAQYERLTGQRPSESHGGNDGDTPRHPVDYVSWDDVAAPVSWLPRYGLALPTEAQWEYACRANAKGKWCFGDDGKRLDEYGWYLENSGGWQSHPVGDEKSKKRPNAWGLFDMHGNVEEWCADWYDIEYYKNSPRADPSGPPRGVDRVLRGGSWFCGSSDQLRSAYRHWGIPDVRDSLHGVRVLVPVAPRE